MLMILPARFAAERGLFNRICQVASVYAPTSKATFTLESYFEILFPNKNFDIFLNLKAKLNQTVLTWEFLVYVYLVV